MKKITSEFYRGNTVESIHKIKVLVKNLDGKKLISTGNDNDLIFPRSAVKIFQAIPFAETKAIQKFKLNPRIIALSCSSHRGESFHIKELKKWLKKISIDKKDLKCGIHYPLNLKANKNVLKSNIKVDQLYNNCAGKHLGMITSCIVNNLDTKNYLSFKHPHQKRIRKVFERFSGKKIIKKNYAVDGCSAPQYSFQIKDISKILANLNKSYFGKFENSCETKILINSIINNPNYIGGTDSLDSRVMRISNKKIFCKGGAEGVFLFIHLKKGIQGVIKVVDGNERAIPPVIFDIFKKLKILTNSELRNLKKNYDFNLFNHAKILTGSIKTKLK